MAKKWVIDTDTAKFIADLPGRHYSDLSFRDAMAGVLLHDALLAYIDDTIASALAKKMEIAQMSVYRWARGVSAPAPRMREHVLRTAAELLESRVRENAQRHRDAHVAFRRLTVGLQDKPSKK